MRGVCLAFRIGAGVEAHDRDHVGAVVYVRAAQLAAVFLLISSRRAPARLPASCVASVVGEEAVVTVVALVLLALP